jgi:hypothetical protein
VRTLLCLLIFQLVAGFSLPWFDAIRDQAVALPGVTTSDCAADGSQDGRHDGRHENCPLPGFCCVAGCDADPVAGSTSCHEGALEQSEFFTAAKGRPAISARGEAVAGWATAWSSRAPPSGA